jgi:hypothetical protein
VNAGLDPPLWHDLFVAFATACAALLGLFYVAMSIHINELENHPFELNRAQAGLHGLLVGLIISLLVLVPAQPPVWLGSELVAVEVVFLIIALPSARHRLGRTRLPAVFWLNGLASFIMIGLVVASGISLIIGAGPGLYLLVPSILGLLLVASYFAWSVLFVRTRKPRTGRT